MAENEAKELVKKLRNKAELFKNSGFAVDGIVKSFEDSANAIETLSEAIQQYRAIGTVEEFKALKEKATPKKLEVEKFLGYDDLMCPNCKSYKIRNPKYCCDCGQKLDWQ